VGRSAAAASPCVPWRARGEWGTAVERARVWLARSRGRPGTCRDASQIAFSSCSLLLELKTTATDHEHFSLSLRDLGFTWWAECERFIKLNLNSRLQRGQQLANNSAKSTNTRVKVRRRGLGLRVVRGGNKSNNECGYIVKVKVQLQKVSAHTTNQNTEKKKKKAR
jgi:hypothetical protein